MKDVFHLLQPDGTVSVSFQRPGQTEYLGKIVQIEGELRYISTKCDGKDLKKNNRCASCYTFYRNKVKNYQLQERKRKLEATETDDQLQECKDTIALLKRELKVQTKQLKNFENLLQEQQ